MRYRTAKRFSPYLLACTCVAATLLVGCGGGGGSDAGTAGEPAGGPAPMTSSITSEPAAEAGSLAVPPDGPTVITEFPIPGGAEIVDIGPPLSGNWQFGISSPDAAATLEFYKTTLAAEGYTLKENVSVQVGANTIEYDLAFFGTTFGIVDENELVGGTLVTVDDEPLDGLEP